MDTCLSLFPGTSFIIHLFLVGRVCLILPYLSSPSLNILQRQEAASNLIVLNNMQHAWLCECSSQLDVALQRPFVDKDNDS